MSAALKAILELFPANSNMREILPGLLSEDNDVRQGAKKQLGQVDGKNGPSDQDAIAILEAVRQLNFPVGKGLLEVNGAEELVQLFWEHPSQSLIVPAQAAYGPARDRCGAALLSLLGATGSREGAKAFMACIRQFGWPKDMYPRVFHEMHNFLEFSDILFPALIELSNERLTQVGSLLIDGLCAGKVAPSNLSAIEPLIATELKRACAAAAAFQQADGIRWRFAEEYHAVRYRTGLLLDVAGWLTPATFEPLLRPTLAYHDPHLLLFSVVSLLRLGCSVNDDVIRKVAASHEMRAALFTRLDALGLLARFPDEWRTWDAFAAADMVNWLKFPTELDREPDELEKMAVFEGRDDDGPARLYVWRFKSFDDKWCAATSGPYNVVGKPAPISGSSTFSSFVEWDSASAEEHAGSDLEDLGDWHVLLAE